MLPSKRVFVAGATGTGKSHFLRNVLLKSERRAIVLDFTGDFAANRAQLGRDVVIAETFDDLRRILPRLAERRSSWRVLTFLQRAECEQLARALLPERLHSGSSLARSLGGVALVCDELNQFAPHSADECILNLWRRGRHVGLTLLGASQSPTEVQPIVRGMSRFLVLFHLHEPNAVAYFAKMIPPNVLEAHETLGKFECLVWDTEQRVGYVLTPDATVRATLSGR